MVPEKKNILVIDDEESIRDLIPALLNEELYNVISVNDGSAGLEMLEKQQFSAVLLDIKMPGKGGFEILKIIKSKNTDIEVLILTGHGTMDEAIAAIKNEASDFIQKPFDNEQLTLAVKNAVKRYDLKLYNKRLIKELSEERDNLLKVNEKLKELDRMKSSFISTVSHELRTPITVIISTINNILDGIIGAVPDYQLKWLNMIKSNAQRLQSLIEDILDMSRLESGKVDMKLEKLDVIALAKKVVSDLMPLADKNNLKLLLNVPDMLPKLNANLGRIEQVITNLITNAVKFTPPYGCINVNIYRKSGYVYVEVQDTGIGIDKESLLTVFDRFRQISNYTDSWNQQSKGIGLGLAIAKEIIAQHNGRIWAESEPGSGSKFIFTLPIGIMDKQQKVKVLAVDDDEEMQELYKFSLERLGCEVHVVSSGELAAVKVKGSGIVFDIIFCDLNLPGWNGVETLAAIKAIDPHVQTAIVTAFPDSKLLSEAMKSGPILIVPKPLDGSKIYEVAKQLMAQKQILEDNI